MDTFIDFLIIAIKWVPWLLSLGGLHIFLYTKYPKYYFWIAKKTSKWRDTNWRLSAQYRMPYNEELFNSLHSLIKENFKDVKIIFMNKNKMQIEFEEFSVTIQNNLIGSTEENVDVEIIFNQITSTYSTANKKLKTLRKFFKLIEMYSIKPSYCNYSLRIKFSTMDNPFFGMLIQRLGKENVMNFECQFPISTFIRREVDPTENSDFYITSYKDYISINSDEFEDICDTAEICLLMR